MDLQHWLATLTRFYHSILINKEVAQQKDYIKYDFQSKTSGGFKHWFHHLLHMEIWISKLLNLSGPQFHIYKMGIIIVATSCCDGEISSCSKSTQNNTQHIISIQLAIFIVAVVIIIILFPYFLACAFFLDWARYLLTIF